MADTHLFDLSNEWDIAFDANQWMIRRRKGFLGGAETGHSTNYRWEPKWYVGSEKRTLSRYIEEQRIPLTPEARFRFDALPDTFKQFHQASIAFQSTAA